MAYFIINHSGRPTAPNKRRLLNYSPFSYHCAIIRQPGMEQIALGRSYLFRCQDRIHRRDTGEVPVPLFFAHYRAYKMYMYNLAHSSNKNSQNIPNNHYLEYFWEKILETRTKKMRSIYHRSPPLQKTSYLDQKGTHTPTKCHPSPFIHKLRRWCKETKVFSPPNSPIL